MSSGETGDFAPARPDSEASLAARSSRLAQEFARFGSDTQQPPAPAVAPEEHHPGSRRFWPTSGAEAPDLDQDHLSSFDTGPAPVADHERADPATRTGRSLFRRLVALEEDSLPAPVGGPAPTDIPLMSLALPEGSDPADDPGEPADQGGDPELDIDQDLDRAAEPYPGDERSRALDLPGPDDLRTGYAVERDADLSGPFDAVEGTSTFPGLYDEVPLADADETGFVPVAEAAAGPDWAERTDLRYGDRVEGWVRPQYQDEPEPVPGEYWTPAPAGSYETEYGWPTPVERLPAVPPYPPSTGFDVPVEVEAEPTAAVPQWPPARPDARVELPRSWSHSSETGPAFRTPVMRGPAAGRFDAAPAHRQEPADHRRFDEPLPATQAGTFLSQDATFPADDRDQGAAFPEDGHELGGVLPVDDHEQAHPLPDDDRVFLGSEGLVLATNPHAHDNAPARPAGPEPDRPRRARGKPGRVPARRGSTGTGPYAAREESLEGPIWTVPDLPEAAMPDLTWAPEEDGRRVRRPGVMTRRRRSAAPVGEDATQALPPMEHDQPRSRPRPRPRPGNGQPESRSTVYVSRHAAEPS
jgi:hypothetical protein